MSVFRTKSTHNGFIHTFNSLCFPTGLWEKGGELGVGLELGGKSFNQTRMSSVPANYISCCGCCSCSLTECLIIFNYFEPRIVLTLALTTCRITHTEQHPHPHPEQTLARGNRKCYCRCTSPHHFHFHSELILCFENFWYKTKI